MRKKLSLVIVVIVIVVLAIVVYFFFLSPDKASAPSGNQPATAASQPSPSPATPEEKPFDKTKYSFSDPTSLWVVVNKKRPLPSGYAPPDLTTVGSGQMRADAAAALTKLLEGSSKAGYPLGILSAYRSYADQQQTYNGWVAKDGVEKADTYSARPGFSEHQTGLAVDLGNGTCDLESCFGDTPAGKWLAEHAYDYGFIVRYQKNNQQLTGYQYEPWHIRYVGTDLAAQIKATGQTLEQFFGLPTAPNY